MTRSRQKLANRRPGIKANWLMRSPITRKIWWWAYVRFPRVVPDLYPHSDPRDSERDRIENEKSKVPQGEKIQVLAFWATEIYGPTEIDALYSGLEALGWDQGPRGGESGCVEWIKEQRKGSGDAILNLGPVQRKGETRYLPRDYFAELPQGIEYLLVQIQQVCSSLTCLLIAFVLDSTIQQSYEEQLQLDRTTRQEPIKDKIASFRLLDPWSQKQYSIQAKRQILKSLAAEWVERHFPGIFSGSLSGLLPTAELISTCHAPIIAIPGLTLPALDPLLRLLANTTHHGSWFDEDGRFIVLTSRVRDNDGSSHILINIPSEIIPEDLVKQYGGRGPGTIVAIAHERLNGVLVRFAIIAMLNYFRRVLLQKRDKLKTIYPRNKKILKSLDFIQDFFSSSVQVPSITGELEELTKSQNSYRWSCEGFVEAFPISEEPPSKLHERLCASTNALANRLLQDDRTTREAFKQISEVVTARESVKAQRRMEWLTLVAITIAVLSLWIALPPVKEWRGKLNNMVNQAVGKQAQGPPAQTASMPSVPTNMANKHSPQEEFRSTTKGASNKPKLPRQSVPPWRDFAPSQ